MSLSQSIWVQLKTSLELASEQNKFKFSAWQKTLTNFPIELCEDMFITVASCTLHPAVCEDVKPLEVF